MQNGVGRLWERLEDRALLSAGTVREVAHAHIPSTALPTVTYPLSVTAQADIYRAGIAIPPDTANGVLPPCISFTAAAHEQFTFPSITGTVNYNVPDSNGPNGDDGDPANGSQSTNFPPSNGLSGFNDESDFFPLLAVFTSPNGSGPSTPPSLSYDGIPAFSSLKPKIDQVFFIGTGTNIDGTLRTYVVPAGAARLYLGFADRYFPDNTGILNVTASAIAPPVYIQNIPVQTISAAPAMPVIPINVILADGYSLTGNISYVASVTYAENGQHESDVLRGQANTAAFNVTFPTGVIRGGKFSVQLSLAVLGTFTGKTIRYQSGTSSDIVAANPSVADISTALAGQSNLQAIAFEESDLSQFTTNGTPAANKPGAFGLFALDSHVTASQVWDWRANVETAASIFAREQTAITAYYARQALHHNAPLLSNEQLRLAALQYYAGGHYWIWNKFQQSWIKNPNLQAVGFDPTFGENALAYSERLDSTS